MRRGNPTYRRHAVTATLLAVGPVALAFAADALLDQFGCLVPLATTPPPCALPAELVGVLASVLLFTVLLSPFLLVPGSVAVVLWVTYAVSRRLDPGDGVL